MDGLGVIRQRRRPKGRAPGRVGWCHKMGGIPRAVETCEVSTATGAHNADTRSGPYPVLMKVRLDR